MTSNYSNTGTYRAGYTVGRQLLIIQKQLLTVWRLLVTIWSAVVSFVVNTNTTIKRLLNSDTWQDQLRGISLCIVIQLAVCVIGAFVTYHIQY